MPASETPAARAPDDVQAAVVAFGREMFGLALSITEHVADAEDAYQEAWASAMIHWTQLREPAKRRAWLASIMVRAALRSRRRRASWVRRNLSLNAGRGLADTMQWDPTLARALATLSARQRAVVGLHYGYGYSLDEAAAVLGCSAGTARSHLARALARLRKELRTEDEQCEI
jgi:RNA polymerase sigma factor (sigma-70 family)